MGTNFEFILFSPLGLFASLDLLAYIAVLKASGPLISSFFVLEFLGDNWLLAIMGRIHFLLFFSLLLFKNNCFFSLCTVFILAVILFSDAVSLKPSLEGQF